MPDPISMTLLHWLWQTTWQAILLAVIVAILTRVLGRRLSPQARQVLWLLVFVRLAMPVLPGSPLSIFGLFPQEQPPQQRVESLPGIPLTTYYRMAGFEQSDGQVILPQVRFGWWDGLVTFWLLGTALFIGRLAISTARFSRRVNRSARAPDSATRAIVDAACKEVGAQPLTVYITDLVTTPSLFGAIRPRLLLPSSALQQLDAAALRSVVLHELEHLNRWHLLADWILSIIGAVHWFNPAAWWAHRQIRAARELICDQSVLRRLDEENSRGYGMAMLALAAGVGRLPRAVPLAAFAQEQNLLHQRIEAIASGKRKYIVGLGLILVAIVVAVFMTRPRDNPVGAQATPQAPIHKTLTPADWPTTNPTTRETAANRNFMNQDSVSPPDPKVVAQLNKVLPELRFDKIGFADVIDFLKDVGDVNIIVNWRSLEAAGIDRASPIQARLRDVKFAKALEVILRDVGGGIVELAYTVEGNVITISTVDDLQRNVVTHVYDIRDLLVTLDLPARQNSTDELMKLIQDTVGWNKYCTMRELNGQLIVTAQSNLHAQIEGLLSQLRETRAVQITIEASVQDLSHESANAIWTALAAEPERPVLDDQAVAKLMSNRTATDKTLTAPRLILFNGQSASFLMGGTDKEFNLNMQTTISNDRRYVTMTIKTPSDKELAETRKAVSAAAKPTDPPLRFERLTTNGITLSVPDGATLPVRMKREIFEIQPDGSEKSIEMPQENREIWMLIKPTIIIQREREQEQFPLLSSHPTTAGSGNR